MLYGGEMIGGERFIRLRDRVNESWGKNCLELLFKMVDPQGNYSAGVFRRTDRRPGAAPTASYVTVPWTFRDDLANEVRGFYYDTPRLNAALGS